MKESQLSVRAMCSKRETVLVHFRSTDNYEDVSENMEVRLFLPESDRLILKKL
jgi:hypothetical protein